MPTICAISTPYGVGGIAVARVSGDTAISIVDSVFRAKTHLADTPANTIVHGYIVNADEVLDEVLVSVFRAPHSFTGEDIVEISTHGSLYVQQTLLQVLINAGARMAEPGEFTQRAFLNGKIDLSQAEAIADIISAESRAAHRLALSQMRGSVKEELKALRERLLTLTALLELELDFADHEDLEFADRIQLMSLSQEVETHISQLLRSFRQGQAIKNGVAVAIVGPTNAGKSTLLNRLVGEERAIVSDEHGTTRDTVEDTAIIDGMLFRFVDTAGLRETDNKIEAIGIERSRAAADKAQLVIVMHDATASDKSPHEHFLGSIDPEKVIHIYNKVDMLTSSKEVLKQVQDENTPHADEGKYIFLSAKYGDIEPLRRELISRIQSEQTSHALISNARHYEALHRAHDAIERVITGLQSGLTEELVSMDLNDCLNALGEITGEITTDQVLSTVFSRFCIGK